jgi:internalin A
MLGPKARWISTGSPKQVLDFYFNAQQQISAMPLYEAKLMIVGEGEVGKTSLAKKILDSAYKIDPTEKSTEGIEVLPWKFTHPSGQSFKVNIWDFGGQEIYHATHQFFLTERSLYLVLVDSRKDNPDLYYWLRLIELLGGNSPVILVKNEKFGRPCQINEGKLREKFHNLEKCLAVNLADNTGLDQLLETIQRTIIHINHVQDNIPANWRNVRYALENDSQNFIKIEEFYTLCQLRGITDRSEMQALSKLLHELGIVLHFQEVDILRKIMILNPAWATDATYKVLDKTAVQKNYGRFCDQDLQEIWQAGDYADMRDELTLLMRKFKLCYPLPYRDGHYIAPHLLNKSQPDTHTWDHTESLILSFKYPFKPRNIFPLFIVAMHSSIQRIAEQDMVWKHGVVLTNGRATAEVLEQDRYEDAKITIRVSGFQKDHWLAIIGHELEKIHASFEALQWETLIPCNCKKCQQSQDPHEFVHERLLNALKQGTYEVQCQKHWEMVNTRKLIQDVVPSASSRDESPAGLEMDSGRRAEPNQYLYFHQANVNVGTGNVQTQVSQENRIDMSDNIYQNHSGSGNNIGKVEGDYVAGDKIVNQFNSSPDLAQAARDIKAVLDELSEEYNADSPKGQEKIKLKAIEQIQQNPDIRKRTFKALKAAGVEALDQAIQHPIAKVVIEGVKGFLSEELDGE